MTTTLITGSTRGIGLGLAREFLKRGCNVVVSGRSQASVDAALVALGGGAALFGVPCDVGDVAQVQALWDAGAAHFGRIDLWINNAGRGHPQKNSWELDQPTVQSVLDTNLLGAVNGCHVAVRGMRAQGGGHIYNMEGFGSSGSVRNGLALYGTSKAALRYYSRALARELEGGSVKLSRISPGIVITDLLDQYDDPADFARAKRIFNILGDRVETVTPWLVEKMLTNDRHAASFEWLTRGKVFGRFLTAPFNRRNLFDE